MSLRRAKVIMKKISLLGLSFVLFALISFNSCQVQQKYVVKSAIFWNSPIMSKEVAKKIASYAIVIADEENFVNNPKSLKIIKRRNKEAKLLCYSNPMELFDPMVAGRPLQAAIAKEIQEKYQQWLFKTSNGEQAIFYPGMIMLNLSSDCPRIDGKTCLEYLAAKKLAILKNKIWDGSFEDNNGGNVSWVYLGKDYQIDANNDGQNDNPDTLDYHWSKGISDYLSLIRAGMPKNKLIIGNKGSVEFTDQVDGRTFEDWPCAYLGGTKNFGWDQCMINAEKTGSYTIFLVMSEDNVNFALASAALIGNGKQVYIAVGQNNSEFHPELQINLGEPLDKAQKGDSCYFRNFAKGRVEVRPWAKEGKIILNK